MNRADHLELWLAEKRQAIDAMLTRVLERQPAGEAELDAAMRHALLLGGKRLRPALTLAACEVAGGSTAPALAAGAAVELVHTYSLVHDDLPAMDDDALRRGQPTVHVVWNDATAILTGDALLTLAFELLASAPELEDLPVDLRLAMVRTLASAAGHRGMVAGQSLDMAATARDTCDLKTDALAAIHRAKTGALIRASVSLGLLAAGNRDEDLAGKLDRYAALLGHAFQVVDDVLDATMDTATLGKPSGSDAELGKLTYVRLLGLDGARAEAAGLCAEAESLLDGVPNALRLRQLIHWVRDRSH
ncbi:MAG: polyprenyl synthetase family protein [Gammaproteobacteria bacterium]|nr:polyprenyl synthetase family protein [Gammaproteobacteria bacterium]